MENLDTRCTVVVSSCDSYEDVWIPFFKILNIQWKNRPYPIVLNTESKTFDYEDMKIKTLNLYKPNEKVNWGERLINTIEHIDSEYVIFTIEDYFLLQPVNQEVIEKCIRWMDENKNIACFYLGFGVGGGEKSEKYEGFLKIPQNFWLRVNALAGLWRKDILIKYVDKTDQSAWAWEVSSNKRGKNYIEEFYAAYDLRKYAFSYSYNTCGLIRGKWTRSVVPLFEQYNIAIDFSKRGFYK